MDALIRFQPAPVAPRARQPDAVAATGGAPPSRATDRETAPFVTPLSPEDRKGVKRPSTGSRES
jgi:hypothetical protein